MFSLRLRNFRSLLDTGAIELRPITILVGRNSSGKSTFTRFLPLLRQSAEANINAPLLWYGDLVDFGTISDVRSRFSHDDLGFDVSFTPKYLLEEHYLPRRSRLLLEGAQEMVFSISFKGVEDRTVVSGLKFGIDKDIIDCRVSNDGTFESVRVNKFDFSRHVPGDRYRLSDDSIAPLIMERIEGSGEGDRWRVMYYQKQFDTVAREVIRSLRQHVHGLMADKNLQEIARRVSFGSSRVFPELLMRANRTYASWQTFVQRLMQPDNRLELERIRCLYFLQELPNYLAAISQFFGFAFLNVGYIGPSRATGERYYRIQELAVNKIDPRGENLAMFLNSLRYDELERFADWTEEYIGYRVIAARQGGHVSIRLRERGSSEYFNLADVGFGLSQLLPVIAQIWAQAFLWRQYSRVALLAIEQPELHLHPAFQARIADALVGAVLASREATYKSSELMTVVETHSQQLINRLGELISAGRISPETIAIYVFEKTDADSPTRVKLSEFDRDGALINWPYGFFSMSAPE